MITTWCYQMDLNRSCEDLMDHMIDDDLLLMGNCVVLRTPDLRSITILFMMVDIKSLVTINIININIKSSSD